MPGRTPIPAATQAKVQFESDRTCCVCRVPGKSIQIHHIDENNRNHDVTNLAVLCRDCHDQTMMKGTFNRRLDSDVVTLFRDDWLRIVAQKRATIEISEGNPSKENLSIALEKLEILKERGQYELLAVEYAQLGNESLRDKYIELALKHGVSDTTQIFLRSLQGKPEKISKACLNRVVRLQTSGEDWSQLARTYVDVRNYKKAIENYCKTVMRSLEENNVFSAAYYLQELCNRALHEQLFEETYTKYEREKNLWWALPITHLWFVSLAIARHSSYILYAAL